MRLKELKCENCGASIKVEENTLQAKCEFCQTTFAVEDSYHDGYRFEKGRMKAQDERLEKKVEHAKDIIEPVGKAFAVQFIVSKIVGIIIFIVVIAIVILGCVFIQKRSENSFDEFDINRFNSSYELYTGTESGSSVGRLIDKVSTNNKKDKKHQITIKYKEISTKDPEKMKEIKKQLDQWTKYEVSFEYDKDGFIYIATIEE